MNSSVLLLTAILSLDEVQFNPLIINAIHFMTFFLVTILLANEDVIQN